MIYGGEESKSVDKDRFKSQGFISRAMKAGPGRHRWRANAGLDLLDQRRVSFVFFQRKPGALGLTKGRRRLQSVPCTVLCRQDMGSRVDARCSLRLKGA